MSQKKNLISLKIDSVQPINIYNLSNFEPTNVPTDQPFFPTQSSLNANGKEDYETFQTILLYNTLATLAQDAEKLGQPRPK